MTSKQKRVLPMGVAIHEPIKLTEFLPFQLYRLSMLIAVPRAALVTAGLTIRAREWRVLMTLANEGPINASQISRLASIDTGSVARAVTELVEAKLVIARQDPADARRRLLTLTHEGAEVYDRIALGRITYVESLLSVLSDAERRTLFSAFDKLEQQARDLASEYDDPFGPQRTGSSGTAD
jgi:DNA-binding MarR family transcriptional regulator